MDSSETDKRGLKMSRSGRLMSQWLVVAAILTPAAHANLLLVNSVASLNPDTAIQWSNLGGDLTSLGSPLPVTAGASQNATLSGSPSFTVFSGSTFNGDFLPTALVLSAFDLGTVSPWSSGIQLDFLFPVFGVGAQVQVNAFAPFTATLEAFGASLTSLGTVQLSSTVLGNGDGSAPFLGGLGSEQISRIRFTADVAGIAINDLAIATVADPRAVPPIPEPSTFVFLASAVAALVIRARRR